MPSARTSNHFIFISLLSSCGSNSDGILNSSGPFATNAIPCSAKTQFAVVGFVGPPTVEVAAPQIMFSNQSYICSLSSPLSQGKNIHWETYGPGGIAVPHYESDRR
jgi:hypothetical protein